MQNDNSHLNPPNQQSPSTNISHPTENDPKLSNHVTHSHSQSQNPTSETQINALCPEPSPPEFVLVPLEKNGALSKSQRRNARRRLRLLQMSGSSAAHESSNEVNKNIVDNNNNNISDIVSVENGSLSKRQKRNARKRLLRLSGPNAAHDNCNQVGVGLVSDNVTSPVVVNPVPGPGKVDGEGVQENKKKKRIKRKKKNNDSSSEQVKVIMTVAEECPLVEGANICSSPGAAKEIAVLDKESVFVDGPVTTSPGTVVGRGSEVAVRKRKKRKRGKSELVVEGKPTCQNTDAVNVIGVLDKECVVDEKLTCRNTDTPKEVVMLDREVPVVEGPVTPSPETAEGKGSEVGVRKKRKRKRGKSEFVVGEKPAGQNTDAVNDIAVLDKECVVDEKLTCQNTDTAKEIVMLDREVPVVEVSICPSLGATEGRESEVAVRKGKKRKRGKSELVVEGKLTCQDGEMAKEVAVSVRKKEKKKSLLAEVCSSCHIKFLRLFEKHDELRNYYTRKCESGEFYCLVCGMCELKEKMSNKLGNKFKDCVALVQHCFFHDHNPGAHRAYAYAVCQIIDWDIGPLLCCPSKAGDADASGLFSETVSEVKEEVTNQAGSSVVNPTIVQGLKDTTNTICSLVQTEDTMDSMIDDNATYLDERCNSGLLGGTANKQGQIEANCTNNTDEREKRLAVEVHLKGVKSCNFMFNGRNDGDYEEYYEVDDVEEERAYTFYSRLFDWDNCLRDYYLVTCENGEYYCLVCDMAGYKPYNQGSLYKNCVALLEHCVSICQTYERKAHRGFARAVCEVLRWNIDRLPSLPSTEGNGKGPSLEESSVLQDEVKNVGPEDNCSVTHVKKLADTNDTILDSKVGSDAVAKDKLGLTRAHPAFKGIEWKATMSWSLPPQGFHKLNFDGSISSSGTEAAVGYIIRNSKGAIIEATACNIGQTTQLAETAEAIALRNGVVAAVNHQIQNIEIEGDSLKVIQALQGKIVIPDSQEYILETQGLLRSFDKVVINHIYREGNRAADWLAKEGHRCTDTPKFSPSNKEIVFFNIVINDIRQVDVPFKKRILFANRLLTNYRKLAQGKAFSKGISERQGHNNGEWSDPSSH